MITIDEIKQLKTITTMKKLFMVLAATLICGACVFTSCKKDVIDLKKMIIGKWMLAEINGRTITTNDKVVYTFVSSTKAYMSASFSNDSNMSNLWSDQREVDVVISGKTMTVTFHPDQNVTTVDELSVIAINGSGFTANYKTTVTEGGNVVYSRQGTMRFTKLKVDYRETILGKWECTQLTGIETYNDVNARLEFFADGTYKYWRKNDNGEWHAVNREFQDYFVDGKLLATRWKIIGEPELREWWEIASLKNGQMQWTALRQNADGTTAQQGMKWVKVN